MEVWLALERQTLIALAVLAVAATAMGWRRPSSPGALIAGAAVGAAFFIWVGGVRLIVPGEHLWAFKSDWRIHFLGWHFFRQEPWHVPPGRIDSYLVPMGTAIGFTDSIPLAAFLLKPFAAFLPMPAQYLGGWLLLCFTLQGFFGALLARLWSSNVLIHVLAAAGFVLVPTLLMRVGHPALCAHWLLLWAIWLYLRTDRKPHAPLGYVGALALIAGLVHPYLAMMVLALLGALALRILLASRDIGSARAAMGAASVLLLAVGSVLTGWWASGLFTVSGVSNLASEGLGKYSMNVLAIITPTGWSRFLPEWPLGAEGQSYEGFHYLGAGLLVLVSLAIVAKGVWRRQPRLAMWWPLVLACVALGLYALSPRVTLGAKVIADLHIDWLERASLFRATARFFWPAGYLLLTAAVATLIARVPARTLVPLLAALIVLQLADLRDAHTSRRNTRHDPGWYEWPNVFTSPVWQAALPNYDHVVIQPPLLCGASPVPFEPMAYLAGIYGLTINGGLVARFDEAARKAACDDAFRAVQSGEVDARSVYLGDPAHIPAFRAVTTQPVVCGVIENVGLCVTAESYARWRDAATLE